MRSLGTQFNVHFGWKDIQEDVAQTKPTNEDGPQPLESQQSQNKRRKESSRVTTILSLLFDDQPNKTTSTTLSSFQSDFGLVMFKIAEAENSS